MSQAIPVLSLDRIRDVQKAYPDLFGRRSAKLIDAPASHREGTIRRHKPLDHRHNQFWAAGRR